MTLPPRHCPACDAELYPVARFRPQVGLSPLAKGLMVIGTVLSAATFLGFMAWNIYLRDQWLDDPNGSHVRPGGGIFGMIYMIPSVIPGLIFGWVAYRLPKSLKLRCPSCTWRERYRIAADGSATPTRGGATPAMPRAARRDSTPTPLDRIDTGTPAPPVQEGGFVVDDREPVERVSAWIRQEFAHHRSAEEIAAELVASGWEQAAAEELVEIGRRQTRHLRR